MNAERSLTRLHEAARTLEDEAVIVRLAAQALSEACPRGLGLAYTIRDHPARSLGNVVACSAGREAARLDLDRFRRVYRSAPLFYDRAWVEPAQRGHWTDLGEWFRQSEFYPLFQPFGRMGRALVCVGARPLACLGVLWPDDEGGPTLGERHRLETLAGEVLAPLRIAALLAQAEATLEGVEHLLSARPEASFLLSSQGQVLASSPAGQRAIDERPEVGEALLRAVRLARDRGRTLPADGGRSEVHVTPCAPHGASAGFLAVLGSSTPPGRERLTRRERELVGWLELGLRNQEIAERLGVAPSTVKTMLERLYRKARVTGRVALLRWLAPTLRADGPNGKPA